MVSSEEGGSFLKQSPEQGAFRCRDSARGPSLSGVVLIFQKCLVTEVFKIGDFTALEKVGKTHTVSWRKNKSAGEPAA